MKLDLQLESKDDLDYFKTLFIRNIGIEQMMYDFYADGVMIRLQINGMDGAQMVRVGLFNHHIEGRSTSLTQFCPCNDNRFESFEEIQRFWCWDAKEAWATFTHGPSEEEVEWAFERIREILHIIYKVCKLKAFI